MSGPPTVADTSAVSAETFWLISAADVVATTHLFKIGAIQEDALGEHAADDRAFPLAQELGIGVLVNRPFMSGRLFRAVRNRELPDWATGFAESWGQFFLKFIVSHPAVTCVIPATSDPRHMADNLGAGFGELPDAAMRERMIRFVGNL